MVHTHCEDHTSSKKKKGRGYVLVVALIFFLVASTVVISGLSDNIFRETKAVREESSSKQGYITSESALEDTVSRIKSGGVVQPLETLTIGSSTATVRTTSGSNGTVISSEAVSNGTYRSTQANVAAGVSFGLGNYGIQTGTSKMDFHFVGVGTADPSGGPRGTIEVKGGVSSGGPVVISAFSTVGGDVVGVGEFSVTPFWSDPRISSTSLTFGNASVSEDIGTRFNSINSMVLRSVSVRLSKRGSPANITVKIVPDFGGKPSTTAILASGTISSSLVPLTVAAPKWIEVPLSSSPILHESLWYWIVLDSSNTSAVNNFAISRLGYAFNADRVNQKTSVGNFQSGTIGVSSTNRSSIEFTANGNSIFTAGVSRAVINPDSTTTVKGSVYTNRAVGINAIGPVFCEEGFENNKVCDTSRPNPNPETLNIPQASIDAVKNEALSGGVIEGDVTVETGENLTIGPKKVNGNIILKQGSSITLTGSLWVSGSVSSPNFSTDPDNGLVTSINVVDSAKNYAIISDDYIALRDGKVRTFGVGKILLLSTATEDSTSTDSPPIELADGDYSDVIAVAPIGYVNTYLASIYAAAADQSVSVTGTGSVVWNTADLSGFTIPLTNSGQGLKVQSWNEVQ
jgi:hypothetical protein